MQTLQTPRNASDTSNLHSFTAGNYAVASHDNQFVRYNHRTAAKLHFISRIRKEKGGIILENK